MSNFGDHPAGFFGVSGFYNGVVTTSFRNEPTATLTRDYGASPTSTKTMSFGGWIKRAKTGFYQNLLSSTLGGGGVAQGYIFINASDVIAVQDIVAGGATTFSYITNRVIRDSSSWYHLWVRIDTTDSTAGDRVQLWVNGVRETDFSTSTAPSLNADTVALNQNKTHFFGHSDDAGNTTGYGGHVYYADWWWLDGSSVSPVDTVGEFKNGVFIPKDYTGASFGNKGWHLKFDQTGVGSPSATTIGADSSGNDNHWTSTTNTNVEAHDCALPDSPENNFATLNPLYRLYNTSSYFNTGNLKHISNSTGVTSQGHSTIALKQSDGGKWYAECRLNTQANGSTWIGVCRDVPKLAGGLFVAATRSNGYAYKIDGNATTTDNNGSSYGNTYTAGDIIGIALDLDNNQIFFYKNGTIQNSGTAAFTSITALDNGTANTSQHFVFGADTDPQNDFTFNFGQDSTFNAAVSAGGNADANGIGDFKYTVPTGYLAVCSSNLPDTTIGPNSASQSDDYFNTVLYDGTGSSNSVTGVGFQPDWVWIKKRSGGSQRNHILTDSMRGVTKHIATSLEDGQFTNTNGLTAFGADGFTVGSYDSVNESGSSDKYVSWNWICNGGTTTSVDAGSGSNISNGTSNHATVQVNQTAGFSMVTTTLTVRSTAVATIPHGLGDTPHWIIAKQFDTSNIFSIYHQNIPSNSIMLGGQYGDDDKNSSSNFSSVGSATFGHQTNSISNNANENHIFYCFREIAGYSKFGAYEGNGNTDGVFLYTGFRPAWLMIKNVDTDGENWHMFDNKRAPQNVIKARLIADGLTHENTNDSIIDFTSNGFKLRDTNAGYNSAVTFVYFAFAETPFKYANAR